jgi:hypothetical protein
MYKDVRNAEDCPGPTTALSTQFDYEGETQLSAAAAHVGMTADEFIHHAALTAAQQVLGRRSDMYSSVGTDLITHYVGICRQSDPETGPWHSIGHRLMCEIPTDQPDDIGMGQWCDELGRLSQELADGNIWGVLGWLGQHHPEILSEVPVDRRTALAQGVVAAYADSAVALPAVSEGETYMPETTEQQVVCGSYLAAEWPVRSGWPKWPGRPQKEPATC